MNLSTTRRERGASILVLMGIMVALLIMSLTLVTLIGNVQLNTSDQRTRDKAAGVGEASLDAMLYQMSLTWPTGASPSPAPTFAPATVTSQFRSPSPSEFPTPATGSLASAIYYDNSDTNGDGKVNRLDAPYDANHDNLMYVEGQGNVADRSFRVQALVRRTFVDTTFPHGVAVYAGGSLTSNGGGNNPKITIEDQGKMASVAGDVKGTVDNGSVFQSTITQVVGAPCPTLSQILPDAVVAQVIALAKNTGKYFDETAGSPAPTLAQMQGLCVIKVADGATVSLGNSTYNSQASPGIMFILGGNNVCIDMAGNGIFWGVMYTEGRFQSSHGTPEIHGMVMCKSDLDMKGTPAIFYNDAAISALADKWTLSVVVVPNTWRQITPLTP